MWRAGAGTVYGSVALLLSSRLAGAAGEHPYIGEPSLDAYAVEAWVESASTE